MKKTDLTKIALMGLTAGLMVTANAVAADAPVQPNGKVPVQNGKPADPNAKTAPAKNGCNGKTAPQNGCNGKTSQPNGHSCGSANAGRLNGWKEHISTQGQVADNAREQNAQRPANPHRGGCGGNGKCGGL